MKKFTTSSVLYFRTIGILPPSFILFSLLFFLSFFYSFTFAQQCPVCSIDLTCDSVPAAPKICPPELPEDTAGQYYSADMTFYIPKQFDDPQYGTVNLNQIDVLGVTGLPAGMSWTAYNYQGIASTSFFPPASPPQSERGCAKICGTPPMPFDDSITVSVLAYVTVSGVSATQNTFFKVHLKIVPNPSGNSVFTMDNSQACDSLTVNFTPNLASNGSSMITYDWDFGNGNTSANENVSQTYTAAGDYTVNCTTKVYQYVVTAVSASAVNNDWCGDVEEPSFFGSCTGSPDMFFQINSNGGIMGSDTIDNNQNPSWSNLNFPLEGNQFIIYFFDEDAGPPFGSPTDSLGYATITASGNGGTYNFSCPSVYQSGTAATGTVTISKQVKDAYMDSDFVHVYAPPVLNPIIFSDDSACAGDSVTLSINGGFAYQWYRDSILLIGAEDSFYVAGQTGNYWTLVTNSYGCSDSSNQQPVAVVQNPPKPGFISIGNNTIKTSMTGYPLQWYLNGSPIPGATAFTLMITDSGYYKVSTFNGYCYTFSDSAWRNYNPVAINIAATNTSCTGAANGSATANTTGGSSPYSYSWSDGQTTKTVSGLSEGNYSVTITDAAGTTAAQSITIAANPSPVVASFSTTENTQQAPNCNGTATAAPSGGTAPYLFLWDNGQTSETATGLCDGNYSVTITDAVPCTQTFMVSVYFVGLNAQNIVQGIKIFPNPNAGKFMVHITNQYGFTDSKITIYNVLGEKVYSASAISTSTSVSTHLPRGIYMLQIESGENSLVKKLVIE